MLYVFFLKIRQWYICTLYKCQTLFTFDRAKALIFAQFFFKAINITASI